MKIKDNPPGQLEWTEFGGLDLLPDILSRPYNSWRRAENVDLFIPGSVRKIVGPQLIKGPFAAPLVELFSYRRLATDPLLKYGVATNGHLYEIDTIVDEGLLGAISQPFIAILPGTTTGGLSIEYVVVTLNGAPPVKWEPVKGVSAVGVSAPATGITVATTLSATNANAYLMQVGIQYLWTYFNPDTLHESSPSPVPNTAIITPTVNQPAPATPYITQVQLTIPTPDPPIGTGYTRIRVYRTQDGGATFFLLPALYNSGGVNQLDAAGSALRVAPTSTYFDGVAAHSIAPAADQLVVNPPGGAPTSGGHNPPPNAIWGAVYQNRLWLLDPNGTRLWFSEIGDFQSFGIFSFFDFSKDVQDRVTSIVPLSDRMIVNGVNTSRQITGTDFSDFVEVPIDMRRGSVGRRAAVSDGDNVYTLTRQSLARLAFSQSGPPFVGDKIKPLTDTIVPSAYLNTICMEIDTNRSLMLFAVKINGKTYNDQIIITDLSKESPFTLITGLAFEVLTIRELESSDGSINIYLSGSDGNVYLLYGSAGALVATLESQFIPVTEFNLWRVFSTLNVFGTDLGNWTVAVSTDGTNFGPQQIIGQPAGSFRAQMGQFGRQIVLQFQHKVNNGQAALLSRAQLFWEDKFAGG